MRYIVFILIALIVIGGLYYFMSNRENPLTSGVEMPDIFGGESSTTATSGDTTSGLQVEDNAVFAMEQRPGARVQVNKVDLKMPGYVVIHADANGKPGDILGTSSLLAAGENDDVFVTLSRDASDGEKLWAMLHSESNGDDTFDPAVDTPIEGSNGEPIAGWFTINAAAEESAGITL
ncbi:MAG: hypothetical protein V4668_01790 [Patescibacteria group bacterium]